MADDPLGRPGPSGEVPEAMPPASTYEPSTYWQRLHKETGGLAAVANPWVPESLNEWFYRNWSRNLRRFVRRQGLRPETVFDVGAGTGFWVEWWLRAGALQVAGCDLAPTAVERLRSRFGPRFELLDVASAPIPGSYDLVSVMNVLLHIMEPARFEQALTNVAAAVAPGGHLLLMEPLLFGRARHPEVDPAGASSTARPVAAYVEPLRAAGLTLVAIEPSTAVGSDPIEGGRAQPAWDFIWEAIGRGSRRLPALAPLMGRLIYAADPVLLRLGAGPSEKFALLRRPAPARNPAG